MSAGRGNKAIICCIVGEHRYCRGDASPPPVRLPFLSGRDTTGPGLPVVLLEDLGARIVHVGPRCDGVLSTAGSFSAISALFGGPLVLEAGIVGGDGAGAGLITALIPGLVSGPPWSGYSPRPTSLLGGHASQRETTAGQFACGASGSRVRSAVDGDGGQSASELARSGADVERLIGMSKRRTAGP